MMKKAIGIDIGTYNIKLIELENKKGRPELTRLAINRIADNDIKTALKDLLSLAKSPLKRVNVSLSGPSVIVRYIEMPPMKKDELQSAIKFEAEKYIPFSIKDSNIDCAMLDKTSSGSHRVLLVAAKNDEVKKTLSLFKEAGLEVNAIDIDSFAFLNCFQRLKRGAREKADATYGLINIGARFSNMNIITKGNVYFTRDVLWGGDAVTTRISDAMGIKPQEAEALKHKPGEKRQDVVSVITPVLERLSSQVRMSFDYFESQFGANVEKLYISGGTAYLFNIVDFLKDNLGVDVVMWDPFEDISISASVTENEVRQAPALFAVAVGLALRQ